jgi:16S rRNA (guanine1516-N2)-methyltransferase
MSHPLLVTVFMLATGVAICRGLCLSAAGPIASSNVVVVGASRIAAQLNLPLFKDEGELSSAIAGAGGGSLPLVLQYDSQGRLELREQPSGPSVVVDWEAGRMGHRASAARTQSGGELIVRAVLGRSGVNSPPLVWDLTAGLGSDSFVLACAGCRVVMVERSPTVASLLEDGLVRLRRASSEGGLGLECSAESAASRLELVIADSTELASRDQPLLRTLPDVVYCDPMFPPRGKTAQVKKGCAALQALLGGRGPDAEREEAALFSSAYELAQSRVVVKRPRKGPRIVPSPVPSHTLESKTSRFDVYVK